MSVHLNPDKLAVEIAIRGVSQSHFAQVAGVSEATVSHAMHGRPVSAATLRALALALVHLPVMRGASELVAATVPPHASVGLVPDNAVGARP